jgi:hypothetical protein
MRISRSRSIVLAAAGAFSVVTASSAAVTSWSARPADHSAGATGTTGPLRLTFAAYQQHTVVKAQRSDQIRLAGTKLALATTTPKPAAKKPAAKKPAAAVTSTVSPTTTATPSTPAPAKSASPASPQQIAQGLLSSYGWPASQFACLKPLWQHESGWSVTSSNAGSGAYGIPQAVPGSRMASAGPDWRTNATTQIKWGLQYIKSTYGSPCAAESHEQATGWY